VAKNSCPLLGHLPFLIKIILTMKDPYKYPGLVFVDECFG
jgi:hypothetical protein